MVNLLLVSHSIDITTGTIKLIKQMVPDIKIGNAGGTKENKIGTDLVKIENELYETYTSEGLIIFYDIGSSLLNCEMLLDIIDKSKYNNIYISKAPIVEGAFLAAIESSLGKNLNEIILKLEKIEVK